MNKFTAYMFAYYDEHPRLNPNGKPIETQADGEVWYRIMEGEKTNHFIQQFRKGDLIRNANDIGNIWSWDGNRKNPTIRPSFLVPKYHFHCYVTGGAIVVLLDSQVEIVAKELSWDEFMYRKEEK
jgi:hypothetical protein